MHLTRMIIFVCYTKIRFVGQSFKRELTKQCCASWAFEFNTQGSDDIIHRTSIELLFYFWKNIMKHCSDIEIII